MQLYDLDTKITDKSYEILNFHIENQKQLDSVRIDEIRNKCRNILEKNGIYEDKKNGPIYQAVDVEIRKLEDNISCFNENILEDRVKNKIDIGIENVTSKIECLEQKKSFVYQDDELKINKAYNENNIRNMLFNFFENYKVNTIDMLQKRGYSPNTIDNIEDEILEFVTSKNSDILTEKFTKDGMRNVMSLNTSLNELSLNILNEAEARYNCEVAGTIYDELKEKRDSIRVKVDKIKELLYQINSIDAKIAKERNAL